MQTTSVVALLLSALTLVCGDAATKTVVQLHGSETDAEGGFKIVIQAKSQTYTHNGRSSHFVDFVISAPKQLADAVLSDVSLRWSAPAGGEPAQAPVRPLDSRGDPLQYYLGLERHGAMRASLIFNYRKEATLIKAYVVPLKPHIPPPR